MSEMTSWIKVQREREEQQPSLEASLVTKQFGSYARYRLRFPLFRFISLAILHLVELILLSKILSAHPFSTVIVLAATSSLAISAWWGALEIFREQVRDAFRDVGSHRAERIARNWIGAAPAIAMAVVLILTIISIFLFWWRGVSGGLPQIAIAAVYIIRAATQIVVQTYHSAVFAIRRIYRPFLSIFGVDLIMFLAILLVSEPLGAWSFPLLHIVSTAIQALLTLHYVNRMFFLLGWKKKGSRLSASALSRLAPQIIHKKTIFAALSSVLMGLDAFFVLLLVISDPSLVRTGNLLLFLSIVGPAIRATHDWIRVFYLDFSHLGLTSFPNLKRWFERQLLGRSIYIALIAWFIGLASMRAWYEDFSLNLAGAFLIFLVVRSFLAFVQMKAFTASRYSGVIISGFILCAGIVYVAQHDFFLTQQLTWLSVTVVVAGIASFLGGTIEPLRSLAPSEWFTKLARETGNVRLTEIVVSAEKSARIKRQIADSISQQSSGEVKAFMCGDERIFAFENDGPKSHITYDELLLQYPFVIEGMQVLSHGVNGGYALQKLLEFKPFRSKQSGHSNLRQEQLVEEFEKLFKKDGFTITLDTGDNPNRTNKELGTIFRQASEFARSFRISKRAKQFVTAYSDAAGLHSIFVAPLNKRDTARQKDWVNTVQIATLESALAVRAES